MTVGLLASISAIAFLLAAFFAGSETAIIAADRVRLRHLADRGDTRAKLLLKYIRSPEYFLSIVLVGTNLGVVGCTATFTVIMIGYFGDTGATVATAILVPSLLIFQEILPKGVFLYYSHQAAILSILPLRFFAVALYPIIKSFAELSNFLARLFGVRRMDSKVRVTMEELLFHVEGSTKAGAIPADTKNLVSRAVELMDFSARDVMSPVDRVVMVEEGLPLESYQDVFSKENFSRLPVFSGDRQKIVGVLSIHNLLRARHGMRLNPVLEDPYIVPPDTPIVEMMVRMKDQGCHMAMVKDRDRGIVGMTTLEDILERLVGAIADEFH